MDKWELSVRKFAHYLLFATGGLVIYFMLDLCFSTKHKILIAIFLGMLMACLDEFHQLYSLNRGPRLLDVGIDTLGVISGVVLAYFSTIILKKINNKFKRGKKAYDKLQTNNRRKNCKSN